MSRATGPPTTDHLNIATDGTVALGGQSASGAGFEGPPPSRGTAPGGRSSSGFIDPIPGTHIVSEAGMRFHPVYHEYRCHTGTTTGPHLHFEVHLHGIPQNPRGWLPGGNPNQRGRAC